jgi:hypothetical protein
VQDRIDRRDRFEPGQPPGQVERRPARSGHREPAERREVNSLDVASDDARCREPYARRRRYRDFDSGLGWQHVDAEHERGTQAADGDAPAMRAGGQPRGFTPEAMVERHVARDVHVVEQSTPPATSQLGRRQQPGSDRHRAGERQQAKLARDHGRHASLLR